MPTQWAHGFYWFADDGAGPPVAPPGRGGYPAFQASVICSSLFGVLGAWFEHLVTLARWWILTIRQIHALPMAQRRVVTTVIETLQRPEYQAARTAVRETAFTPHFTRPEMWVPYGRILKAQPRRAENIYRHVKATERMQELVGTPIASVDGDLLVRLAYQEYRLSPWGLPHGAR